MEDEIDNLVRCAALVVALHEVRPSLLNAVSNTSLPGVSLSSCLFHRAFRGR
jgi:hypothetical protein